MDTWLSGESKRGEGSQSSRSTMHKLNSIKARLRNARSEVYCTLQVRPSPAMPGLLSHLMKAHGCLVCSTQCRVSDKSVLLLRFDYVV